MGQRWDCEGAQVTGIDPGFVTIDEATTFKAPTNRKCKKARHVRKKRLRRDAEDAWEIGLKLVPLEVR